jgi:hypothetical protein
MDNIRDTKNSNTKQNVIVAVVVAYTFFWTGLQIEAHHEVRLQLCLL